MASPSEGRSPHTPRAAARAGGPADGARDRLLAALVALAGDLTVEREERACCARPSSTSWARWTSREELTLLLDESGEPQPVGELHAAVPLRSPSPWPRDVVARDAAAGARGGRAGASRRPRCGRARARSA